MIKSRSFIATPPGATIKEQLLDRQFNQKEFAMRMNLSEKHVSKLINGEVRLTPDVAVRLEMVLGVPARFWSNLEAIYREKIVKAKAENEMDAEIEIAKKIPYKEMAKMGWIPEADSAEAKVVNLRKYFEVVHLTLIENSQINKIACRRLSESEKSDYALMAWAQKAKLEARKIETAPVNSDTLRNLIPEIRTMTTMKPAEFCPKLTKLFASCGVAVVFLPHIGGSFLHGATFSDGNKITVGLTVRGKYSDKFWFSLFHELGHIFLGHINPAQGASDGEEAAADQFAENTLIPIADFNSFKQKNDFSRESVIAFAESEGIDSGIVVGRLQKEACVQYNHYNDLRTKYSI